MLGASLSTVATIYPSIFYETRCWSPVPIGASFSAELTCFLPIFEHSAPCALHVYQKEGNYPFGIGMLIPWSLLFVFPTNPFLEATRPAGDTVSGTSAE